MYRESYRDLLQTAERIIDMDVAAQSVEAALGDASRNCNSRLLERKVRNLRVFNETTDKRGRGGGRLFFSWGSPRLMFAQIKRNTRLRPSWRCCKLARPSYRGCCTRTKAKLVYWLPRCL